MTSKKDDIVAVFKSKYEGLAGRVYLVRNPAQATKTAEKICSSSKAAKVAVFPTFPELNKGLDLLFVNSKFNKIVLKPTEGKVAYQINEAEVGMTPAEFAIAETGTIVEVSTDDTCRLISSLPRVHIAFVKKSNLLLSLEEAGSKIKKIYQRHGSDCNMTFISGPSRTADIEMKLFLGVHGPQESHVVVCDWD
ncbi:hypothetical protein GWO43_28120 [candidate division KSB1 bacterium]|nr:hypothetical protein [candidate division KSB1 bacterium]NIR71337.1 hypothetical protein [candidate division KSB1 bacterium]NIS26227.1 hypothetical protein [candidate division KSB1 bacterium]NIT74657.1 hypothetical protein [candidate division KSB1 bacterium]NIU26875.1 hypothetical protein [candidate division KSB1 bacterium]